MGKYRLDIRKKCFYSKDVEALKQRGNARCSVLVGTQGQAGPGS